MVHSPKSSPSAPELPLVAPSDYLPPLR